MQEVTQDEAMNVLQQATSNNVLVSVRQQGNDNPIPFTSVTKVEALQMIKEAQKIVLSSDDFTHQMTLYITSQLSADTEVYEVIKTILFP
jgi:hypothetical protein